MDNNFKEKQRTKFISPEELEEQFIKSVKKNSRKHFNEAVIAKEKGVKNEYNK